MKRSSKFIVALLAAASVASLAAPAHAAVNALTSVTSPTVWPNGDNQDHSLGWKFHVSSAVTVSALGYNDHGFGSAHNVGIYSAGGSLLASASVTGASTLDNGYRYAATAPLLLGVGDYYIVGTTLGANDGWIYQASSFTTDASISYLGSYYTSGTGGVLAFPVNAATDRQYLNVNFQIGSGVPEPSTWAMMLIGFAGLGWAARRRRLEAA